jgi:hypothetical protein
VPKIGKRLVAVVSSMAMAAGLLLVMAAPASADYGRGAVRQIEISANLNNTGNMLAGSPTKGGGIWLWIELNADGTGDYTGSDCGHGLGAVADKGDITWSGNLNDPNATLTINGVNLVGLGSVVTINVPAKTGHYSYPSLTSVFTGLPGFIPPLGFTQLQVAP